MQKISRHKVLVAGDSYEHCLGQVTRFFDLTTLVIYDLIEPVRDLCICGGTDRFQVELEAALQENRRLVRKFVDDLEACGTSSVRDLAAITQGFHSKTLHILSHFLDGFVGIDSHFYNILEDSHWVSDQLTAKIEETPERFWLIHIDCFSASPEEATLLHMEKRPQRK